MNKRKYAKNKDALYPEGAIFQISGDSASMWIHDYDVRVNTYAEVLVQPNRSDKKVLVRLNDIDGDSNVNVFIKKDCLLKRINFKKQLPV